MSNLTAFQREIPAFLEGIELRFSEPLSKHTSFRIGGPAEVMAFPKNTEWCRVCVIFPKKMNVCLFGKHTENSIYA